MLICLANSYTAVLAIYAEDSVRHFCRGFLAASVGLALLSIHSNVTLYDGVYYLLEYEMDNVWVILVVSACMYLIICYGGGVLARNLASKRPHTESAKSSDLSD